MKTIIRVLFLFTTLTLLFTQCELFCDDCVHIPDRHFKAELIERGVDTNGDGSISFTEAEEVNRMRIGGRPDGPYVKDVTGIEAFIHLDTIIIYYTKIKSLDLTNNTALTNVSCYRNQLLTSLDVSNCTALTKLYCAKNQLTSLDVSKNTALTHLECPESQLSILDVSNCTVLECLSCSDNQLTSLDLSNCTLLTCLNCAGNQLTSLDLSNSTSFGVENSCFCVGGYGYNPLSIINMPSLYEVCFSDSFLARWEYYLSYSIPGSPNVYFTSECSK